MTPHPRLSAPKGTRDLLPADATAVLAFEGEFASLARLYGFSPLVTPAFEHTEVFERGVGEATDIVNKEMYTFADRGGRSMTLRPEGTAPVMRAFIEHGIGKSGQLPWKVFYAGPMWRYERPQAGRMREFRQVGAESIGSADPQYDVELIEFAARFFDRLRITEIELLVNSMGDEQCRPAYSMAFASFIRDAVEQRHPLCDDCTRRLDQNPLRILDCKKPGCRELTEGAPAVLDSLCFDCIEHFEAVKGGLTAAGVEFKLDPRLVRGLDYYTRTTFEFRCGALDAAQDALGGGGRYDGLAETLGGEATPALGFAIGTERTIAAIAKTGGAHPPLGADEPLVAVVMPLVEEAREVALQAVSALRSAGVPSDLGIPGRSAKAQLRTASKAGARVAVLIGSDEIERGLVTVRFLEAAGGEPAPDQLQCAIEELVGLVAEARTEK